MMVTLRTLFRTPFTTQYPEEIRPIPVNARTNLLWFEERCTGCSTCAQACPDGCILVQTSPREDGSLNVDRYEIDFRLCMYCGLCVEACPHEAIPARRPPRPRLDVPKRKEAPAPGREAAARRPAGGARPHQVAPWRR